VAVATARRDVAADAVRTGEGQVRAIRDRHEQGLVVESDLLAAEVQLAAFRQELITAEGELAIARAALAVLLQRPIVEQIGIVEAVPERRFEPAAVDALVARATERRGAAQAAALASRSAALAVRTARGALLPRLDAFASWSSTGPTFRTRDSDRAYGLVASIDLFDGGKYARITAAKAAAAEAEAAAMAASDGVAMEVVTAHARLQSAAERVNVASSAAEQAAAAARIVRDRYENGLTTITEQLRADHALLAARLAFLDARYDYITGYADLLRATGDLTDVDPFV
jgi:outer membrane protein TolC